MIKTGEDQHGDYTKTFRCQDKRLNKDYTHQKNDKTKKISSILFVFQFDKKSSLRPKQDRGSFYVVLRPEDQSTVLPDHFIVSACITLSNLQNLTHVHFGTLFLTTAEAKVCFC